MSSSSYTRMKLLFCALLLLHSCIWALSLSFDLEPGKNASSEVASNETIKGESIQIKALLDYESGLVFYKDDSVSACLVEKIPESILDSPDESNSPTFKIPIPSDEVCIGRDNELLKTEPILISEPGLLFCSGLAILDISKLVAKENLLKETTNARHRVRRKRQSNGYYRSSHPTGEARAQSNRNFAGEASQAQVQGQVFGSGFFSGQAQSQNGGMSQSQVQLSGVGIRGQIASSSGNAQAQLSLGTGAGSGQASGLGEGPSNSQVQVSLGQQGEESMASASATSGGARVGIGAPLGAASTFSGQPIGPGGHYSGFGQNGGFGDGSGFIPGTRLFDNSGVSRNIGNGVGHGERSGGGQPVGQSNQLGNGYRQGRIPDGFTGLHHGDQGVSGGGRYSNIGDGENLHYGRNRHVGGNYGDGTGHGSISGTLPSIRNGLRTNGIRHGAAIPSGADTSPHGISGNVYDQGRGASENGGSYSRSTDVNNQGIGSPASSVYRQDSQGSGSQVPRQSNIGSRNGNAGIPLDGHGSSYGQPTHFGTGSIGPQHSTGAVPGHNVHGTGGYAGDNGHQAALARSPDRNVYTDRGMGGLNGENGRYGSHVPQFNGATHHYPGVGGASGRPYSQSITPGAHATTYGLGQAQAQTVFFGNAGNGQYVPLRYDQSSHPGGTNGIQRFQDQQVALGTAGQRQQLPVGSSYGVGTPGSRISGTHGGSEGLTNSHRHTGLRNGHTSYGLENGGPTQTTVGQHPVRNGGSITSTNGIQQGHISTPASSGGIPASHPSVVGSSGGDATGYRPEQPISGGPSSSASGSPQTTGYSNGLGTGLSAAHLPSPGYLPGSTRYQNGHRQATSTSSSGRNGHTHVTNGHGVGGGHGQQQVPSAIGNARVNRINTNGQQLGQASTIPGSQVPTTGDGSQDGFSPSYGIARPSQDDPEGRKCTIITFSCSIVIESNGRAKICKPNAVKMNGNGNGNGGGNGSAGSKICCC